MTTKDSSFLSNKSLQSFNPNASSSGDNGQYSNLNLNNGNKCSLTTSINREHSIYLNNGKTGYGSTNQESVGVSKNMKCFKDDRNKCVTRESSSSITAKNKKNGKLDSIDSNDSLSLHIRAYENSIEASTTNHDRSNVVVVRSLSPNSKKRLKNVKQFLSACRQSSTVTSFEIPRQQQGESTVPEVMGFKASQKLLNPNNASTTRKDLCNFVQIVNQMSSQEFPSESTVSPSDAASDNTPAQEATVSECPSTVTATFAEFSTVHEAVVQPAPETVNTDDSWEAAFTKDYSKNNLFSIVFNGEQQIQHEIPMLPDCITVPPRPGKYLRIYKHNGARIKDDKMPWKGKPRYSNFVIEYPNGILKATESRSKTIVTHAQCYSSIHEDSAKEGISLKKTVFTATTPSSKTPANGTLIVILYEIDTLERLPKKPDPLPTTTPPNPFQEFGTAFAAAASEFQKALQHASENFQKQVPNFPLPQFQFPQMAVAAPSSNVPHPDVIDNDFDVPDNDFANAAATSSKRPLPPLSFHTIDPPSKRRKRADNKVEVPNYHFALNNKLDAVLLVVPNENNTVYHYSKSCGTKLNNEYYACLGCTRLKLGVKSSAVLEKGIHLWVATEHCCTPVSMEAHLKEQADRKSRKLVADGVKPRTGHDIFFKETAKLGIDVGEYDRYRRQYSRWRGAFLPGCVPGRIDADFHYLYPPASKNRWLLFETKDVTGFASDLQLRVMAEAEALQTDATYGTSPTGYKQYLTIHALVGENGKEWQPVFMAVMNGKKEAFYDQIVTEIKNYWQKNNIIPTFKKILSDYEPALQNALMKLDDPAKVWGCSFHYSNALLTNVRKLGLMPYYSVFDKKEYPEAYIPIRTWIRSCMALPLLPIEERNFIWDKVLKHPPVAPPDEADWPTAAMAKFVKYVESTWFSKLHNTWCFFGGGRVKNTNRAESWNSLIAKLYDHKPKYNVFVHDQQLLFSKAEKRLEALARGEKAKEQQKKYKILVDRIIAYEDEYLDNLEKVASEQERIELNLRHLRRVQYLLHDIRNKSGSTKKSKKFATVQARAEESALWNADLGVKQPEASQQQAEVEVAIEAEVEEAIENGNDEIDNWNSSIDALIADEFDREELEAELKNDFEEMQNSFIHEYNNDLHPPEVVDLASDTSAPTVADDSSIMVVPHNPNDRATVDKQVRFEPPCLEEIEEMLKHLLLDPGLAANSPLLGVASSPVDAKTSFVVEDVFGDGNCCWRSASVLLTGSEEYYWEIRAATFKELRDYADIIHGIRSETVRQEYAIKCEQLAKLSKGGVDATLWGGATELLGLASLLTINIVIFNQHGTDNQPFFTPCSPVGVKYASGCKSLFLKSLPNHYQAITGIISPEI